MHARRLSGGRAERAVDRAGFVIVPIPPDKSQMTVPVLNGCAMARFPRVAPAPPAALARLSAIAASIGAQVRDGRLRRRWTTERLAREAGVSRTLVYLVERGEPATLETYARLGVALGLRFEASLDDPRSRARPGRAEDPVHAAIVEMLAARYAAQGRHVAADEPFQHFQFAGRADVTVVDPTGPDLLHHEVKTAIVNVGELAGAWNVKRRYLAATLAERHGARGGFRSVTHVLTIAWTADCLHVLRLRGATIRALGPDAPEAFARWWDGARPQAAGIASTVVIFDPIVRPRAPAWAPLDDLGALRARHRGYADLLRELRDAGRA
jgi:transcriptional regulator with XRE-family HTH domain